MTSFVIVGCQFARLPPSLAVIDKKLFAGRDIFYRMENDQIRFRVLPLFDIVMIGVVKNTSPPQGKRVVFGFFFWFFSNLVGEEGPRIQGFKGSRACFLKTLSATLTFFRFLRCLYLVVPIHLFQLNLNLLLIISAFPIRKQNHKICKAS